MSNGGRGDRADEQQQQDVRGCNRGDEHAHHAQGGYAAVVPEDGRSQLERSFPSSVSLHRGSFYRNFAISHSLASFIFRIKNQSLY